jgi:pyruvate dehydrogenase complex dehydrogenase (E1) component
MVLRANKTGDDLGGHLAVSHLLQPYMMLVLTISSAQIAITLAAT